jgi:hypothetical protein
MRNLRQEAIASSARAELGRGRSCLVPNCGSDTLDRVVQRVQHEHKQTEPPSYKSLPPAVCLRIISIPTALLNHICLYYQASSQRAGLVFITPNNPAISHESTPPNKNSLTTRRKLASTRRRCSSTSAVCLYYAPHHHCQELGGQWEHTR